MEKLENKAEKESLNWGEFVNALEELPKPEWIKDSLVRDKSNRGLGKIKNTGEITFLEDKKIALIPLLLSGTSGIDLAIQHKGKVQFPGYTTAGMTEYLKELYEKDFEEARSKDDYVFDSLMYEIEAASIKDGVIEMTLKSKGSGKIRKESIDISNLIFETIKLEK